MACYKQPFCFGLRLIQAPNKPAGYHSGSGTCRAQTISYLDTPSHFFVPVISYHFGSLRPIFYNGVLFISASFLFVKIYFQNRLLYKKMTFDQMHIGKFYHLNCNTVLCRLFNSVNPLCLFVSHNVYTRINIIIIIL